VTTLSQQLVLTGSFDASSLALRVSALTGVAAEDVSMSSSTAADGSTVVSLSVLARGGPGAAALAQQALVSLTGDASAASSSLGVSATSVGAVGVSVSLVSEATSTGDLHVHHAGGGQTDIKGVDGAVCVLHQSANVSLNALFTFADFTPAPEDPRSDTILKVHGSHLTAAFVSVRTAILGEPVLVRVSYEPDKREHAAHVTLAGLDETTGAEAGRMDVWLKEDDGVTTVGDVTVEVRAAAPIKLLIKNANWEYAITPGTYRLASDSTRRRRIDVSVVALTDPLAAAVAPHGLVGQGFDGLHIEGKTDNYQPDAAGVFTTSAQGEGAIEGVIHDYIVDSNDPFSAAFKYGRFDARIAAPRDTSHLNKPRA
jgi:hypothetical protein